MKILILKKKYITIDNIDNKPTKKIEQLRDILGS